MKHLKKIALTSLSVVLFSFFICSCVEQGREVADALGKCPVVASRVVSAQGDTVVSCRVADVKVTITLPLSDIVDSLEIIKLDNREEALMGNYALLMGEHYIGARYIGKPYKLFTRQGKFVCDVGAVGQGPGEYTNLYDSQIDEKHNRIYLLPWPDRKILVYDLKGNYLHDIPLAFLMNKGAIRVDTERQRVCVTQMAFEDAPDPAVWIQNFGGNVLQRNDAASLKIWPDYSSEFLISSRERDYISFSFHRCAPLDATDTLYHYYPDDNVLRPILAVVSQEMGQYGAAINEYPCFYTITLFGKNTDSETLLLYTYVPVKRIIVQKGTLQGACYELWNDLLGGIKLDGYLSETGYVANMEPGLLLEAIEKRLQEGDLSARDREFLAKWRDGISEEDNNYIIYGKYK